MVGQVVGALSLVITVGTLLAVVKSMTVLTRTGKQMKELSGEISKLDEQQKKRL